MMQNSSRKHVISSKKGIPTFLFAGLMILMNILALILLFLTFIAKTISLSVIAILGCVLLLFGFLIAVQVLTQIYTVSLEGIELSRFGNNQFVPWSAVTLVMANTTFYNSYDVIVNFTNSNADSKNFLIFVSSLSNGREFAQAIGDAMKLTGENDKLDVSFKDAYGEPPFGILSKPA